jgi:LysM repeat protein
MKMNNLTDNNIKVGQVLILSNESSPVANPLAKTEVVYNSPAKKEDSVVSKQSESQISDTVNAAIKETSTLPTEENSESKNITEENNPSATVDSKNVDASNSTAEGYFTSLFGVDVEGRSLETKSGSAMSFKSASGWTDKKYYVLMNEVPPGSIVKIASADNRIIYAKVLWNLGGIKENEGLNCRISNAAASALGISDEKFQLTVTYYE